MLLPHRTAWTTPLEFQSVFSDLFESDASESRQLIALSRIAVWQTRSQCPSSVESTGNFMRLILMDQHSSHSQQELRLSYSMAIIRFVNSLVDPLQTAYFARSISSLAQQLGLPLWFVELRHQATHEELPNLPILRQGATQALDWLYTNYWLPALSSSSLSSTSSSLPPLPLEPFISTLHTYKSLSKSLQKDASQSGRIKNELTRVWREFEKWGIENGVSTNLGGGGGGRRRKEVNPNGLGKKTARETRERGMEVVAGVLVDNPGWLVPLAKKKRPSLRSPSLPNSLVELYTPLLEFLDESLFSIPTTSNESEDSDSDSFLEVLISRIIDNICSSSEEEMDEVVDPTIHATLQAWVLHLLPTPQTSSGELDSDAVEQIETVKTCLIAQTTSSIALVEALLESSRESMPRLVEKVTPLLEIVRNNRDTGFAQSVNEGEVERVVEEMVRIEKEFERRMAARSNTIESLPISSSATLDPCSSTSASTSSATTTKGWKLLDNFKPSPIGMLPSSGFEGLDLVRNGTAKEVEMQA